MDLQEYQELKKKLDQLQRAHDKLEGMQESLKQQLQQEFNCSTLKEGEKLLQKSQQELSSLQVIYDRSHREWETQWRDKLE